MLAPCVRRKPANGNRPISLRSSVVPMRFNLMEYLNVKKGRAMSIEKTTHYGDNFIPVILTVDDPLTSHTEAHPFCWDETCLCHEDQELLTRVNEAVATGLLTADEAATLIQGRMI